MQTKLFEIRDRLTYIPVLCVKPGRGVSSSAESKMWQTSGYGNLKEQAEYVLMYTIDSDSAPFKGNYGAYAWHDRTSETAHQYIIDNWYSLDSGSVVDVEYILGETISPKISHNI